MFNRYPRITIGVLSAVLFTIIAGCGSGITMKAYNTAEEQYSKSMDAYRGKNYLKAIDGFQKVVYNFSGAQMVDSAQYYLAMSYYQDKDFFLAASEFERLVNNYPGSPYVDDAQYMSGLCYFKSSPKHYGLDQVELFKALEMLHDFVTDYPQSELIPDAKETIKQGRARLANKQYDSGRMYHRLGYYTSARIYFQSVIDDFTDSEFAPQSLYYLAEIEQKTENLVEAKTKLKNFLIIYPEHKFAEKAKDKINEIEKKLAETETN